MRLEWQRPAGAGRDPELLLLAVLAGATLLAALWFTLHLPTPRCVFHAVTGWPCVTCGGTRCAQNLLAGRWTEALAWNPLVFAGLVVAGIFAVYAAVVTLFRLPRLRLAGLEKREKIALRVGLVVLLLANWAYLFHHFATRG